jgi:hypothetical protein
MHLKPGPWTIKNSTRNGDSPSCCAAQGFGSRPITQSVKPRLFPVVVSGFIIISATALLHDAADNYWKVLSLSLISAAIVFEHRPCQHCRDYYFWELSSVKWPWPSFCVSSPLAGVVMWRLSALSQNTFPEASIFTYLYSNELEDGRDKVVDHTG